MKNSISRFVTGSAVAATLAFSLALPSMASAQGRAARVGAHRMERMQTREQAQIRKGLKDGSLSKAQAIKLADHLKGIQSEEAQMKASGNASPKAMKTLDNQLKGEAAGINKAENFNKDKSTTPPPTMPPTTPPSTTPQH